MDGNNYLIEVYRYEFFTFKNIQKNNTHVCFKQMQKIVEILKFIYALPF